MKMMNATTMFTVEAGGNDAARTMAGPSLRATGVLRWLGLGMFSLVVSGGLACWVTPWPEVGSWLEAPAWYARSLALPWLMGAMGLQGALMLAWGCARQASSLGSSGSPTLLPRSGRG